MPKYRRTWSSLLVLGLALGLVSRVLGMLVVAAGMIALVIGMVAERREWEAKHKNAEHC